MGCRFVGRVRPLVVGLGVAMGCGGAPREENPGDAGQSGGGPVGDDGTSADDGPSQVLDVGDTDGPPPPEPSCAVVDDMNAVGSCDDIAPPGSFEPEVQWSWGSTSRSIIVTPLVANLTDDNGDGSIDLCDVPDVVVVAGVFLSAELVVLDGATGQELFTAAAPVAADVTPAIGDIDGDGLVEIIAATPGEDRLIAFENDGTHKWTGTTPWANAQGGAIGIANLDADGEPEIYADGFVADDAGITLWQAPAQTGWFLAQNNTATVAADLDGDGDMELILGQAAYHHDGTEVYRDETILPGYPQIANLDDDDDPEILINNQGGITILEHDGTPKVRDAKPTGDPEGLGAWFRPSTVHDFDGDEISEFAVSSASSYSVFEPDLVVRWSATVQDGSGWATGTAFDFLGDGGAEAMYGDEANLFVFDWVGQPVLTVPRSSSTLIEYPVVADVDNDGSAEIIVVSNPDFDGAQTAPAVQVIRDRLDRWIQARRIWNQHTYHVTNVREDGTIPTVEPDSWRLLNTYRTNAQIEEGAVCKPIPEG